MATSNSAFHRRVRALRAADPTLPLSQARTLIRAELNQDAPQPVTVEGFRALMGLDRPRSAVPRPIRLGAVQSASGDAPELGLAGDYGGAPLRPVTFLGNTGMGKTLHSLLLATGVLDSQLPGTVHVLHVAGDKPSQTLTHPGMHRVIAAPGQVTSLLREIQAQRSRRVAACGVTSYDQANLLPLVVVDDTADPGTWVDGKPSAEDNTIMARSRALGITWVRTAQRSEPTEDEMRWTVPVTVAAGLCGDPMGGGDVTVLRKLTVTGTDYPVPDFPDPMGLMQKVLDTTTGDWPERTVTAQAMTDSLGRRILEDTQKGPRVAPPAHIPVRVPGRRGPGSRM